MSADRGETGLKVRREVLGNAHVDRTEAATTQFDAAFQRMINEGAWGAVWARPNWTLRERSMWSHWPSLRRLATTSSSPCMCGRPATPALRQRT